MAEYSDLTELFGLQSDDVVTYSYTGAAVSLTLPKGIYRLKCYGAQGGYRSTIGNGGQGGYAEGVLNNPAPISAFINVGGSGNTGGQSGGFNGGGARTNGLPGGGGASDIRLGSNSLYSRVIVAGGGGSDGASSRPGGHGGGLTGVSRGESYGSGGGGATQTAGGTGGNNNSGSFGIGGNGLSYAGGYGGAGGGGWYGGGGVYPDGSGDDDRGGGGGSGFVWTGQQLTLPSGGAWLLSNDYALTETAMSQGDPSRADRRNGDGLIVIEIIEIGRQKFLARDAEGVKAWSGAEWVTVASDLSEELFLEHGADSLPRSVNGLLDDAELLLWTDREEVAANHDGFTFSLAADVTAPTQTITQVVPFALPTGAAVERFALVSDTQNGGSVGAEIMVTGNDIVFKYTLEKPTAGAVAGIVKQNTYFKGAD